MTTFPNVSSEIDKNFHKRKGGRFGWTNTCDDLHEIFRSTYMKVAPYLIFESGNLG